MIIHRAPVLTLWATIVAQRVGYSEEQALTLGKAVAGTTAQFKGRTLSIYTAKEKEEGRKEHGEPREAEWIELVTALPPKGGSFSGYARPNGPRYRLTGSCPT